MICERCGPASPFFCGLDERMLRLDPALTGVLAVLLFALLGRGFGTAAAERAGFCVPGNRARDGGPHVGLWTPHAVRSFARRGWWSWTSAR